MTTRYDNYDIAARNILNYLGKTIVMGVPLGIGKPIGLLNAIYHAACIDSSVNLTIITGLTLARPTLHNDLEKRLVEPILDRLLKDYEDPLYEKAREAQQLPHNVKVIEFFLAPGVYLNNANAQQNYISSKYTSVIRDTLHRSINLFAQQVAPSESNTTEFSLSSNSDLFRDVVVHLRHEIAHGKKIAIVAEINCNLPFMPNDGIVTTDDFTDVIDTKKYKSLFAIPRDEISLQEHLIGFYSSLLVRDNGCLQIGIGKLSNAVANALIMRHQHNDAYQDLVKKLQVDEKFADVMCASGDILPFEKGLYASTEMFSDEYMQLMQANILTKRVYDHVELQKLLNADFITEIISAEFIDRLLEHKLIQAKLTESDIQFLQKFGIFKAEVKYRDGFIILSDGEKIPANFNDVAAKNKILSNCLGTHLKHGKLVHAGFFLGTNDLYDYLRSLKPTELDQIDMTTVSRTNTLLWNPELALAQRQSARFINSAMMITLAGAAVSDGLANLQEYSGIGGQFDFVSMAQNIPHARSILNCRSTRKSGGKLQTNIVWDYTNISIPRYLRDIVVTEYGIADCRSKTDAEVIQTMLNITDSRFQDDLLKQAKKHQKVPQDYEIPAIFRNNYPTTLVPIMKELQAKGYFKPYPFGSDLTSEEETIKKALLYLKKQSKVGLIGQIILALVAFDNDKFTSILQRMKLDKPKSFKEFLYKKLLIRALKSIKS